VIAICESLDTTALFWSFNLATMTVSLARRSVVYATVNVIAPALYEIVSGKLANAMLSPRFTSGDTVGVGVGAAVGAVVGAAVAATVDPHHSDFESAHDCDV